MLRTRSTATERVDNMHNTQMENYGADRPVSPGQASRQNLLARLAALRQKSSVQETAEPSRYAQSQRNSALPTGPIATNAPLDTHSASPRTRRTGSIASSDSPQIGRRRLAGGSGRASLISPIGMSSPKYFPKSGGGHARGVTGSCAARDSEGNRGAFAAPPQPRLQPNSHADQPSQLGSSVSAAGSFADSLRVMTNICANALSDPMLSQLHMDNMRVCFEAAMRDLRAATDAVAVSKQHNNDLRADLVAVKQALQQRMEESAMLKAALDKRQLALTAVHESTAAASEETLTLRSQVAKLTESRALLEEQLDAALSQFAEASAAVTKEKVCIVT